MRELFTSLFLTSCLLPPIIGAIAISSSFAEASAPHILDDINADPLWSSTVKRVNPDTQDYERLPATLATDKAVAKPRPIKRIKMVMPAVRETEDRRQGVAELQVAKAQQWCATRYRSYNSVDNTYQPYGGGPRQVCAAPLENPVTTSQQVADVVGADHIDADASWCMQRYSSYRIEDNTYQPFSGSRKKCLGPRS